MTETQAKAQIVVLAGDIDRIDTAITRVEEDIQELTRLHEELVTLYSNTADRIEKLAGEFESQALVESVLRVTAAMKRNHKQES